MNYHIKKIDAPWIMEVIIEGFDQSALNIMTESSLIYGGAIRDALAGLSLVGDLDIVVPSEQSRDVVCAFNNSPKWIRYEKAKVMPDTTKCLQPVKQVKAVQPLPNAESVSVRGSGAALNLEAMLEREAFAGGTVTSKAYKKALPIDKTLMYEMQDGVKAQVVVTKPKQMSIILDDYNTSFDVIKSVDIVCCGVAMDKDGNVFEVVGGAYDDCKDRILRFNKASVEVVDIDNLKKRIEKLEKRGWTSKIDIEEVEKKHKRIVKIKKGREQRRKKKEEEKAKAATPKKLRKERKFVFQSLEDKKKEAVFKTFAFRAVYNQDDHRGLTTFAEEVSNEM